MNKKKAGVLTVCFFEYSPKNPYRFNYQVLDFREDWRGTIDQIRTFFLFSQIIKHFLIPDLLFILDIVVCHQFIVKYVNHVDKGIDYSLLIFFIEWITTAE